MQTADGTNQGPDCLDSADECLWPGRDPPTDKSGPDVVVIANFLFSSCFICHLGISNMVEFFYRQQPPEMKLIMPVLGQRWKRLDRENNVLRQEVGALNSALSEIFSVVGRLRDDLDGVTADHDRLAEQVGWQHVGMVRLGGFNPYQSLSIQQRQQVFARERRNMMAYRSTGPSEFMDDGSSPRQVVGLAK